MQFLKMLTLVGAFVAALSIAQAAAADAAFTPAKLGGCVLWLRGDVGVATDRAGNVTKWQDQSGKGNDLDRIVNAGPVVVNGPNGRPVIQFDGRGYAYSSHDLGPKLARHCTILLLARWLSPTPADCRSVLASQTVNWKFGFQDGDDQSWIGNQWIYQRDWNLYGGGSPNADWHLHTGTLDDAARDPQTSRVQFWKDGLMLMDRPMKLDRSLSGPRQIALGGPTLAKCEIGEVAIFDRGLDPAELTAQWKYFSDRYKVTSPAYAVSGSPPAHFHTNSAFPIAVGPFKPDWRSLAQYECPDWFRDAKFGIWAHWSPQCQPEQGDWYAQHIYEQGSRQYEYHVAHYGHPSMFGYKDICNQWKADKWDPEKMIRLYKSVGAKYFVALANHHDNFDCWDSTYQPWNSVKVGPKKDIVGTWAALARKHGLHFGVTVHSARAWEWFDAARRSDTSGPLKGVPYDGILTKADGKGKWWDGLDPADLYGPHGADRTPAAREAYIHKWFCRTKQLVDKYQPDLLYFDDTTPPLGDAGMSVVAHFLNSSMAAHGGKIDVVYNTKIYDLQPPAEVYKALVNDYEGGRADSIQPYPWQTDTCIGNWHYYRGIRYRSAESVVKELVDVVSKNGNLLLNIPVKGDGSLDDDELNFLAELKGWMDVNGECIFSTRPWRVHRDGAAPGAPTATTDATANDVHFTAKDGCVYAIVPLPWKSRDVFIRSLSTAAGKITTATMVGHVGPLDWKQTDHGLQITLPANPPSRYACAIKIAGDGLVGK